MTTQSAFTPEEWARLERAPFVAGMAITVAQQGGMIDAMKESMATLTTVTEVARLGDREELVIELARSIASKIGGAGKVLEDFQPGTEKSPGEMLAELHEITAVVRAKATPQEADAFRNWLLEAAMCTAHAAKEGGFLGIAAKRVGEGEQEMLNALSDALS